MNLNLLSVKLYNNKKVIENYFFMTALQALNSLFYLAIYPFLIRTMGAEPYGLYVFAMSIVAYFMSLVNFGFEMPAVKEIAQHPGDDEIKTKTLSCVFTAKVYLEIISGIIFIILISIIPALHRHWWLYTICFANTVAGILFPIWYFQGMQMMRVVTYIQVGLKLLSLPFIFLMIQTPADVGLFAFIATSSNVLGAIVAAIMIRNYDRISIRWMNFGEITVWYKDALPFFWSNAMSIARQQSTITIIGAFFSMGDVALYDLANKIVTIPTTFTANINAALFPKMVSSVNKYSIKKLLKYEFVIGCSVIVAFILFGKAVITILGGVSMMGAYPILVILGFSILVPLLVGNCYGFIFVPNRLYAIIAKNQLVALVTYFVIAIIGLFFCKNIIVVPVAMLVSGMAEIMCCSIQIYRLRLL